jgi:polyferredoxin
MECIACTQCIDACDDIMTKLKRPTGLIKYSSENGDKRKIITARSGIYVTISVALISLFIYFLNVSINLNMVFLRSKIPFQVREEVVLNHFTLKLSHQGSKEYHVEFQVNDPDIQVVTNSHPTIVNVPEKKIVLFFKFPVSKLQMGTKKIMVNAIDSSTKNIITTKEVTLVGPTL